MLNVIVKHAVIMSVFVPSVVMLNVMFIILPLSVIMLSVIILSVVAPPLLPISLTLLQHHQKYSQNGSISRIQEFVQTKLSCILHITNRYYNTFLYALQFLKVSLCVFHQLTKLLRPHIFW